MTYKLLGIALAGAVGTLARYGLAGVVQRWAGAGFPWGTFAVNLAGCFLFGLVWSMAESRVAFTGEWRAVVLVGFMGAFTTFSTFAFETVQFLRDAQWALALANFAAHNVLGMAGLIGGLALGRII